MGEYNYVKEVDYISSASILIKKSVWDEIWGFDKRYKVMYQPKSVVIHYEGISNGKNLEKGIKKYHPRIKKIYRKLGRKIKRAMWTSEYF